MFEISDFTAVIQKLGKILKREKCEIIRLQNIDEF